MGIYYLEKERAASFQGIYDRAGSSIAEAVKEDFGLGLRFLKAAGLGSILQEFTPALGDNIAEICMEAVKKAKEKGITVSCDLNYRNKLWSKEKAGQVMGELCKYVDVCIANEEDAGDVFRHQSCQYGCNERTGES